MKCLVCGHETGPAVCPACGFPVYWIAGERTEAAAARIRARAERYWKEYLGSVSLGVVLTRWEDRDGRLRESSRYPYYFAEGEELLTGSACFGPQELARIPGRDRLCLRVCIRKGDDVRERDVWIDNLEEPRRVRIGAHFEDHLNVRLVLDNGAAYRESEPFSVARETEGTA